MKNLLPYLLIFAAGLLAGKSVPVKNPNYAKFDSGVFTNAANSHVYVCVRDANSDAAWQPVYEFSK